MKKIFLTVDTECHDINNQDRYLWGRTHSGKEYGLRMYLELGKELNIPINFFVDVAECKRYGVDFVKHVVDFIKSYGQPVYFHLHPNFITGDDNRSFFWQYSHQEKKRILEEAYGYYKEVTGSNYCVAFRAGRYGTDSDFYDLISSVMGDDVVDLSYSYGNNKMCHLSYEEANTINGLKRYKSCWLLPNTTYIALKHRRNITLGVDTSQTTLGEFKRFLKKNECTNVVLTSHSWNFIRSLFFVKYRVWGNDSEVGKFKKMVSHAQANGYVFDDIKNIELKGSAYEQNNLCDLCSSPLEQFQSIIVNFVRFQKVALLSPKYFKLYFVFYLALVILSVLIVSLILK